MFTINIDDNSARTGKLKTKAGIIKTPFFMPIATKGSVKQLNPDEVKNIGAEAIISNAFILALKPGLEILRKYNGIHKFINWNKTIFTDSGGFQILSKSFLHKANEKGVHFKNPYTGEKKFYSPEDIMKIEEEINSDVAMALDFVPHYYGTDKEYVAKCVNLTHDWAERCKNAHTYDKQLLFGICQGGVFKDLREKSAEFINSLDFDGNAIGGLCVGEDRNSMFESAKASIDKLDKNKIRYLMGIGSPEDILEAINLGADCFDSRFPTMNSRHGGIFTSSGKISIDKAEFKDKEEPLDINCKCYTCTNFSKAFIHHMYKTHEPIAERYGSIHNLHFIQKLIENSRKTIEENNFEEFKKEFLLKYKFEKKNSKFNYN